MSTEPKKMSANQEVVAGFDLSSFVSGADKPSETITKASKPAPERQKGLGEGKVPQRLPERPSAPLKPEKDHLTERVQVRLSKAEVQSLQEKIGMVPVSAYLRKLLKDNGLIG